MAAYSPLAVKLFGSPHLGHHLKLVFLQALIMSTLIFNAHVRVLDSRALSVLNAVYMRVVRRIVGQCRFDSSAVSDREVRKMAGVPSIDCLIQRARLNYLVRLVTHQHRQLIALLSIRSRDGSVLPWLALVRSDLNVLYLKVAGIGAELPPPNEDPTAWYDFMRDDPDKFRCHVRNLSYIVSVCDSSATTENASSLNFPCVLCPVPQPAFKSSKALESHKRVVHGCRSNMRFYAPESGICYACQTNFNSRLRLLAHLVDSRRPKCRDTILQSNFPKLPESEVQRLDICDRTYRRIAKRAGHSHVLAAGAAIRANGTVVGRVFS